MLVLLFFLLLHADMQDARPTNWKLSFFCFKQKTAYEMRISDWSSDVCSSDLAMAKALRAGFIRYDRGKGWSGPIATIEADDKWQRRLASSFMGIDYEDWRVAAVLSKTASEARLGFADGSSGRLPASAAQMGDRKRGNSAFVAMKPGDLIPVQDRKSPRMNSSH